MWFVGALVHVPGSALVVLGENMIKKGNADAAASDTKPWLCKAWLQGAALFVAGNISHFIAFMFAAQSLLEGLGAFMFVFNLLFATRVNKEVLANRHLYATGVIVCGISLVIAFGSHKNTKHTFSEITELLVRPVFMVYTCVVLLAAGALQLLSMWAARDKSRELIHSYSYACSSAMAGSFSVVLSKSMAESLHNAFSTGAADPMAAVLFFGWVLVCSWWLYRLNICLHKFPALFVVPLLHAVWLVCTVVSGGIFFKEFDELPTWKIFLFVLGILILLVGVVMMPHPNESAAVEDVGYWLPAEQGECDDDDLSPISNSIEVNRDGEHMHVVSAKTSCM